MESAAPPPRARLEALRAALGHRGPDDSGVEIVANVGLVHTRLAIVDPGPAAHQPMRHPGGSFWLVYNGEVYNHGDLRREFRDGTFSGHSDTESVMWALQRSGLPAVTRFDGQFAFAALDLSTRRLLLCRDRFGIKPLYIASFAGGLWFASELGALIEAGAPARPAAGAFGAILAGSRYGGSETLVAGVLRLGPGAWASIPIDGGQVTSGRWHAPATDVDQELAATLAGHTRRQLRRRLEEALREAVRGTLMADVPVGALLSGGVDSSLILALAAQERAGLVAFTADHGADPRFREGTAARRVAAHVGVELEVVQVTPASWRQGFVAATLHFGAPLTNASAVTAAELAQAARRGGVKVLLTGEGADELFGGYDELHAGVLGPLLGRRQRLLQGVSGALGESRLSARSPRAWLSLLRRMVVAAVSAPAAAAWGTLTLPAGGPDLMYEALTAYAHHAPEVSRAEAALLAHLDYTLCWLLQRADASLMQHSVEGRVPFLGRDVVRLVLNLPLTSRIAPLAKGILRDVAASMLPAAIAYRPKVAGMDFDAGGWIDQAADPAFLHSGILRDVLSVPDTELRRVIATDNGRLRTRVWSAEIWCRSVFAGHSQAQIEADLWRG